MTPLRERLRCEDEADFNLVARELSSMPRSEAIELLEELAHERDGTFRCRAIDGMVNISPEHAERLAIESLNDAESFVRLTAIEAVGKLRVRSAAPTLARLLATDPEELVRSWAAFVLGRLGDTRAIPILEAAAKSDTGVDHEGVPIRDTALNAIAEIRARED